MAGIKVDVVGLEPVIEQFSHIAGFSTKALLSNIEAVIDRDLMQRFKTSQAPDGTPWLPSKAAIENRSHKKDKSRKGKTLVDQAHLRDSFHGSITGDQLLYGSAEDYAAIHQFGGKNGRGLKNTVIARPMIGISAKQLGLINNTVSDFVEVLLND